MIEQIPANFQDYINSNSFKLSTENPIYNQDFLNYECNLTELRFTKKQINILKSKANKIAESIIPKSSFWITEDIIEDFYVDKCNEIYEIMYKDRLDKMKKEFSFQLYSYYSSVQPLIDKIHRNKKLLNKLENIKEISDEDYKLLKDTRREIFFQENNLSNSKHYFNLFEKNKIFKYLEKAVNLQKSALSFYIHQECNKCGYEDSMRRYDSNDRFDLFSSDKKVKYKKKDLAKVFRYLDSQGKTYSHLIIPYRNISLEDFSKEYFTDNKHGINKVLKEFMRYKFKEEDIVSYDKPKVKGDMWTHLIGKRIEDIYDGYYGVVELTWNEKTQTFHPHIHLIMIRDKPVDRFDKITGFIPQPYLSSAQESVCNKFGNEHIKGSKIVNVGASHLKNYYKDKFYNLASYLLQYVTKGIDVKNPQAFEKVLFETQGVRFERSAGLLSSKNRKSILEHLEQERISSSEAIQETYSQAKELIFTSEYKLMLCSTINGVRNDFLTYYELRKVIYGKKRNTCLFCNTGDMDFKGLSKTEFVSDLTNPEVLSNCCRNLGIDTQINLKI